eukprot:SAG22_NODE_2172_length_2893_cov_54.990694_2_plen_311_part_00
MEGTWRGGGSPTSCDMDAMDATEHGHRPGGGGVSGGGGGGGRGGGSAAGPVLSPPATPVVSRHASRLDDAARAGWQVRPLLQWGEGQGGAMDSLDSGNSAAKRKRTPLEGSAESTALRAFELLGRMCHRARPAHAAGPPHSFWSLPYDQQSTTPQLVVQIERYVLPQRNLRFTVFNDACFLARVIHEVTPLQSVEGFPERGGGYVAVKPSAGEGFLRLVWPTLCVGSLLDELCERSLPCVDFGVDGGSGGGPAQDLLSKRLCTTLTLESPAARAGGMAQAQQVEMVSPDGVSMYGGDPTDTTTGFDMLTG